MNDNSFLLVLAIVGVLLGALLLFSTPPAPADSGAVGTSEGAATSTPQAAIVSGSVWANAGEDRTVGERETIQLQGSGGETGGGSVTYLWTADTNLGFFSDPTRPDAKYTAPSACDCCSAVTLTLAVMNRVGSTAYDSMTIRLRDVLGCPSLTPCGERPIGVPAPCPRITVTTHCPKPDVPCSDPCVTEAPLPPACDQVPTPCLCASGCGPTWSPTWPEAVPTIEARDRATPRIVRQFPSHVAEGASALLRAVIMNPACSSVCFAWSADHGWFERSDTLEPVYHAPLTDLPQGERVTITFTIRDASGLPSYDQVRIQVDDMGTP